MTREEQLQQFAEQNTKGLYLDRHNLIQMAKQGAAWADQHPNWIPVEEELPPHDPECEGRMSVDCYISDGVDAEISHYNYYNNTWDDVRLSGKVTHWYIPQPPRKEDKK